MKTFYIEEKMTIEEKELFVSRITDTSQEFYFTHEQFQNRLYGRTKIKPAEKIAMKQILNEIRQNIQVNLI